MLVGANPAQWVVIVFEGNCSLVLRSRAVALISGQTVQSQIAFCDSLEEAEAEYGRVMAEPRVDVVKELFAQAETRTAESLLS